MVHRAILGSYERFLVLLLEQFKGILPIWLSPVQVQIIPVNIKYHDEYCKKLLHRLLEEDIRAEYDNSNERMGKKIRQSNMMKNPITVIIGDSERDKEMVSFKKLGSNDNISMSLEAFISYLKDYIKSR